MELAKFSVDDLIFTGVHGSTGREPRDSQRFAVDLEIAVDAVKAAKSDSLDDAFDYKIAVAIAKHVIEGERCVLLETLAFRIAQRICRYENVWSAKVKIKKIDSSQDYTPGIEFSMRRSPQERKDHLLPINAESIFKRLEIEHAVSVPILNEAYRHVLLEEAGMYEYERQPEIVKPSGVQEQLSSVKNFFSGSLFLRLREDFEDSLAMKSETSAFKVPLSFNEMSLQLYEKGSIGITPHRDFSSNINLVCIFILAGVARFATCDDREGTNPKNLDTTPGNVIIMRAPGFMGSDFRPFHLISDVAEQRIVFGLRQSV